MNSHRRAVPRCAAALAVVLPLAACGEDDGPCIVEPGTICTWAGTGEAAFDGDGNPRDATAFYWPIDLTFMEDGTTYVIDWNNHRVRRLRDDDTFETVVGSDFVGDGPDDLSDLAPPGAPGTSCLLNHPTQLLDVPGEQPILVSWHNHKLRRFDPETGLVVVIAGRGADFAGDGGPYTDALLNQPTAMTRADDGTLYLVDQRNQVVRRIGADGIIESVVGTPRTPGFAGDGGPPGEALLSLPTGSNPPPGGGVALGLDGILYVSDTLNHRVRRVDFAADQITTLAGTSTAGFSGDGGPAAQAQLNNPREISLGPDGRLYVADELNHRIRAVDLDTGTIETVAGNGQAAYAGDGGPAADASLNRPGGFAFDAAGDLFVADTMNNVVRQIGAPE
jgi:hypothetical protein